MFCLYLGGSSQHVARLYTRMLLLELTPGATRPSTDIYISWMLVIFVLFIYASFLFN